MDEPAQGPGHFSAPDPSQYAITRPTGPARTTSPLAGGLLLLSAGLIFIGTLLPWAVLKFGSTTISTRTAYQLGGSGSVNSDAIFIDIAIVILALIGLRELGIFPATRFFSRSPLIATIYAAFVVLRSWLATWNLSGGVHVQRGIGGWVAMAGLACGLVASVISLRARPSAASGPPLGGAAGPARRPNTPPIVS